MAEDLTCVAAMGTNGCGFEQQLEAVLEATIGFHGGTRGHAGLTHHLSRLRR